jgi:phosphoserine/homoserine phosphotransferase
MKIVCFDLEGTLAPELWIEIAEHFNVPELEITTRDEPDEDKLMLARLGALKSNQVHYSDIIKVIQNTDPFEGAKQLLSSLAPDMQPVIVTSSYYQFIPPILEKIGSPFAFANYLSIENDFITSYKWRMKDHKRQAVEHFKAQNFEVYAVGDSYNDIPMFEAAGKGILFRAPDKIKHEYPNYASTDEFNNLAELLRK